jgi:hypothetical protein
VCVCVCVCVRVLWDGLQKSKLQRVFSPKSKGLKNDEDSAEGHGGWGTRDGGWQVDSWPPQVEVATGLST